MAEGFEPYYHVPQQSRREKLRVLAQNQPSLVESTPLFSLYDPSLIPSDLLTCHNQPGPMFHSNHTINVPLSCDKENQGCSRGVGVVNSSSCSSSSYLDPANIQVNNNNPFLYQPQNLHQNLREFEQCYNGGSSEMMVFKPDPLSLELNLQRYGSVIYGDKVGGGVSNEVFSRNTVPLGPFTGSAMILKGSRFLKPVQQLLEEVCDVGVRGIYSDKVAAADDDAASLMEPQPLESLSGGGITGVDDLIGDRNEGRKKKPRLLTMLDEVFFVLFCFLEFLWYFDEYVTLMLLNI